MKVLTFSRQFPAGHPQKGEPTLFIEKILMGMVYYEEITIGRGIELARAVFPSDHPMCCYNAIRTYECKHPKFHTIRVGSRWKVGDMASLRVWSGRPYQSKQVEFAQVEIMRTWVVRLELKNEQINIFIDGKERPFFVDILAANDGLSFSEFYDWFNIHNKKKAHTFIGQIICWSDKIDY